MLYFFERSVTTAQKNSIRQIRLTLIRKARPFQRADRGNTEQHVRHGVAQAVNTIEPGSSSDT